jgi:transcriptional regulator with XRE-family HTH domain
MAMKKTSGRPGNSGGPGTENKKVPETETGESGLKGSASQKTGANRRNGKVLTAGEAKFVRTSDQKVAELKKTFGKNLARIRKAAGYSQLGLSLDIEMTHNFINDLEHGTKGVSFQTLLRLSDILRTPVHAFFEAEETRPPAEDFRYRDPVDRMVDHLHETIDEWSKKWVRQKGGKKR